MIYLFCGMFVILGVMTAFAWLRRIDELKNRLLYLSGFWALLTAVFLGGVVLFGIFAGLIAFAGTAEMMKAVKGNTAAGLVLLCVSTAIAWFSWAGYLALLAGWLLMTAYLFISLSFWGGSRANGCAFVFFIITLGAVGMQKTYILSPSLVLTVLLLIAANNTGGYFAGKRWGKTRIVKNISPNKTLEGYLAGFFLSVAVYGLCCLLLPELIERGVLFAIVFCGYTILAADVGDLLFSAFKRKLEVKDFSRFLGRHGGILDRFDDILYVFPGLYLLLRSGCI